MKNRLKYSALECDFIVKYGNNVHSILKLDVNDKFLLESKVCSHYILCLLRIHVVVNIILISNRGCYENTHDIFTGGNKIIELTELMTLEICLNCKLDIVWESENSLKGERVQIAHHDVGGATALLTWWLSVPSVTQSVKPCPLLFPFRPISGCAEAPTFLLESSFLKPGRRNFENFLNFLSLLESVRTILERGLTPGEEESTLGANSG